MPSEERFILDVGTMQRDLSRTLRIGIGVLLSVAVVIDVAALAWLLGGMAPRDPAVAEALRTVALIVPAATLLLLVPAIALPLRIAARQRRNLAQLGESRARNRAIVDNILDGAVHIDGAGNLVALNAAAERMFGHTSADLRGRPLSCLLGGADRVAMDAHIEARRAAGAPLGLSEAREVTGQRADGSEFPLYLAISEVDVGGLPVYTAIARDMSEHRARMQELARARDEALDADRAKSQFLAVMSHEIRTPMNGLLGMLDLLRDSQLSRHQQELIDTAEHSGNLLLNLINDILDLSKIEAGKLDLQDIDFDLRATVEEITALAATNARDKDIEIASFVEPAVPALLIGDPYRVRQVLMNLIGNAVKFTARGEVVVHVGVEQVGADDVTLRIRVVDTGIGIAPEVAARLFRPFTQADASTTRRFGGTGLGLVIAKRLVNLMGGEIGVDSEPGAGSSFWLTLRLGRSHQAPPNYANDLRGVPVLIVDDNATNRLILENYLGNWGAVPESVPGGPEALLALRRALDAGRPFALAVLDMQMPGMDGLELAQHIKGDPTLTDTRLLMLSSMGHPGAEARRAGIAVSLLKPVRQGLLHDAVAKVLGRPPAAGRPKPPVVTRRFRARVLVAEDNPVNQKVASMMLHRLGIEADVVGDGAAAVQALLGGGPRYDLVLMDVQMPVLGGLEATRQVRAREQRDGSEPVPIVAMTAAAAPGDRTDCINAGMDDFLSKPFERVQLETLLLRWLPERAIRVPDSEAADAAEPALR